MVDKQLEDKTWEDKFEEEFAIHFKDSKGELLFALEFIDEIRHKVASRAIDETKKHGNVMSKEELITIILNKCK